MIHPQQLVKAIIDPALKAIGLHSEAASQLVLGTACQESQCGRYLIQLGGGPALGIFQMEPATHNDIWQHFLKAGKPTDLGWKVMKESRAGPSAQEMIGNLWYAAAMCRVHYYRRPEPLPAADDIPAQAAYWKKHYNTHLGAGTVEEYLANWKRYAGDLR